MTKIPSPENPQVFLRELQRLYFPAFLERAWPHICGGQLLQHNWHIDAIAHQLDRVVAGDSKRLIVNLPPRNGKSIIISIAWVAWRLGCDPTQNFVCVSYSNELSAKLARDCLSIMQSAWYRELFPRTIISARRSATHDFETTRGGGRLSTSVAGTLTGRGGDILILDDVIKPDDASSQVVREAVNEWYRSTLVSRLNDKETGAIICVMQRLHQFDLTGMLLEGGNWDQIAFPAIATEDAIIPLTRNQVHERKSGDILHPQRESRAVLDELRISMGSAAFAAQYQQDPLPAIGNIFRAEWLKTTPADFDPQAGQEIIQSWDTGIKDGAGNSWSVCITALMDRKKVYIFNIWRGRVEFPQLKHKVIELAQLFNCRTLLIEDKASGQQLIQTLRAEDHQGVPAPIARTPETDKFSRAEGVSSVVEAGQVYLPQEAHWLAEFKAELLAFPNGRYDDQVDAFSQLLDWTRSRWQRRTPSPVGPTMFIMGDDGIIDAVGEHAHLFDDDDYGDPYDDPWGF